MHTCVWKRCSLCFTTFPGNNKWAIIIIVRPHDLEIMFPKFCTMWLQPHSLNSLCCELLCSFGAVRLSSVWDVLVFLGQSSGDTLEVFWSTFEGFGTAIHLKFGVLISVREIFGTCLGCVREVLGAAWWTFWEDWGEAMLGKVSDLGFLRRGKNFRKDKTYWGVSE